MMTNSAKALTTLLGAGLMLTAGANSAVAGPEPSQASPSPQAPGKRTKAEFLAAAQREPGSQQPAPALQKRMEAARTMPQPLTAAPAMAPNSDDSSVPSDDLFQKIVEMNVFRLKPPPPPPDPEANKPPPPKLYLTGIMTIFGKKQALMKAPPSGPPKPGEAPKERYYTLTEKEKQDDVEVVEIDEIAKKVKVLNAGVEQTLVFSTNAPPMAAGAPVPMPGAMPSPTGFTPATPPNPYMQGGGMKPITIPSRTLRTPGAGYNPPGAAVGNGGVDPATAGLIAPSVSLDGRTLNLGGPGSQGGQYTAEVNPALVGLNRDELGLVMEAERLHTAEDVQKGLIAPMPVTHLTQPGAPGTLPDENVIDPNAGVPGAITPPTSFQSRFHRR
ncbi:MAG: hypothetical protein C5B50_27915 [Verrucomicrobia bacterium]|nr:MAG: hypothetical protein C5B50_27915 [Verrucomicrobiota bacterium]